MTIIIPKTCGMGGSKIGLVGTIGVTLLNPDGTVHTARTILGIYEIGGGCYGKKITFSDNWKGIILWDTGGGSPVYATEDYDGAINFIKSIEGGRWKIINNQMIFYKNDNVTEVARFNLLDKDGLPAEKNVMERTRV